jgi:hypothetical protein
LMQPGAGLLSKVRTTMKGILPESESLMVTESGRERQTPRDPEDARGTPYRALPARGRAISPSRSRVPPARSSRG